MIRITGLGLSRNDDNVIRVSIFDETQENFDLSLQQLLEWLSILNVSEIIFLSGGNLKLPEWFVNKCEQLGIEVKTGVYSRESEKDLENNSKENILNSPEKIIEMNNIRKFKALIKAVGRECGYEIDGTDSTFEIYTFSEHPISFKIKESSNGYLQVHIWEDAHKIQKEHQYGKARYSLRTALDVVRFCNILNSSYSLRARRLEE